MTKERFVEALVRECPEASPIVDEHLRDFDGDVQLHLLIADVLRLAIAMFDAHQTEPMHRCLGVVASGLTDGDEYVQNAVAVSFVEDTPWWDEQMLPFIAMWPEALRTEAERFRAASGGSA